MKPKLEVIMMFLRKKAKKKSPFICRMDNSLGEWKDDDGKVLQAFLESPTGKKLFDKILRDIVGFTLSPNIALTKEKDAFRRGMIATVGVGQAGIA